MTNPGVNFQTFHLTVKMLLQNGPKFLLVQEPDGIWEAPGGRIDRGEDLSTALRRELREELGIHIESIEHDDYTIFDFDYRTEYEHAPSHYLFGLLLHITLKNPDPIEFVLSSEHVDLIWIDKTTNIDSLKFRNDRQKRIFQRLQKSL